MTPTAEGARAGIAHSVLFHPVPQALLPQTQLPSPSFSGLTGRHTENEVEVVLPWEVQVKFLPAHNL